MSTGDLRAKLAKVLGMLGSAHDGEVLAAARRAEAMVRAAGLTWPDIIGSLSLPSGEGVAELEMAEACLGALRWGVFDDREARFLASIVAQLRRKSRGLSEKQADWLRDLYERASAVQRAA